jgi:hypothetical protein
MGMEKSQLQPLANRFAGPTLTQRAGARSQIFEHPARTALGKSLGVG